MNTFDIASKLATLTGRGVVVSVSLSRTLQVRSASLLTPDDRAWLGSHAGAILAHLDAIVAGADTFAFTGNEPWDSRVALDLMAEADATVEQLGVDGRNPAVKDAAAMVASAFATRDMETVRFAVSEFVAVVRRLVGAKNRESACPNLSGLCGNVRHPEAVGTVDPDTP